MNLKKIFSVKNKYDGLKKYKLVSVLGLEFSIRTSSYKDFKLKLLNDLENYDGINCEENQREKCTLSICAIYKNEPDIKEWIEYHRIIGVDRFYLYDNESDDNSKEILKPYIEKGIVVYKYVKGKCKQLPVYRDAVIRYKNETEWMAIIDLDEYIVPISKNNIKDFLKDYEQYPAIGINWVQFDSNGLEKRPNKPVIEAYTRVSYNIESNKFIKTILKPKRVVAISSPHFCFYNKQGLAVDENFEPIDNKEKSFKNHRMPITKIRINHYHTKSLEDWQRKLNLGFADSKEKRKFAPEDFNFQEYEHDYTIQKYLPTLKEALKI